MSGTDKPTALSQDDAPGVETWLREEVAPAYDAMEADPSQARSSGDVFAAIRDRHAKARG